MKYFIILLLLVSFKVDAQTDTNSIITLSKSDVVLTLGFEFKHIYQSTPFDIHKIVDPEIDQHKRIDTFPYTSPLMHGALYFGINYNLSFKNKYSLNFKTYFEQRSWSFGVNNMYFYNYYPEYSFIINDTIKFSDKKITFYSKLGNIFLNDELESGLKVYNIEIQGVRFIGKYNDFEYSFLYVADLVRQNMKVDEFLRTAVLFKKYNKQDQLFVNGLSYEFDASYNSESIIGAISRFNYSNNLDFSFLAEYKLPLYDISEKGFISNLALLLGMKYQYKNKKSIVNISTNFRMYGYGYRKFDTIVNHYLYRAPNPKFESYSRVYTIKNYFRPVSQYALYSEYQGNYNVYSFELFADWDWKFSNKFGHKLNVEIINIHRDSKDFGNQFTYVYYTSFLYYNFYKGFKGGIYISNKQMNRDVQYQTFYQMQTPFFGFHITYDGAFELLIKGKH